MNSTLVTDDNSEWEAITDRLIDGPQALGLVGRGVVFEIESGTNASLDLHGILRIDVMDRPSGGAAR